MQDPLKIGFYYISYTYQNQPKSAVYFNLESAQEALVKMMIRGVECSGLYEWKPDKES